MSRGALQLSRLTAAVNLKSNSSPRPPANRKQLQITPGTTAPRTQVRSSCRVTAIHGDMDQHTRVQALKAFSSGKQHVLVATDVAARGLDIKSIKNVVNFDAAKDIDTHVHRVGRTGRAGDKEGTAYTLLDPKQSHFAGGNAIRGAMKNVNESAGAREGLRAEVSSRPHPEKRMLPLTNKSVAGILQENPYRYPIKRCRKGQRAEKVREIAGASSTNGLRLVSACIGKLLASQDPGVRRFRAPGELHGSSQPGDFARSAVAGPEGPALQEGPDAQQSGRQVQRFRP